MKYLLIITLFIFASCRIQYHGARFNPGPNKHVQRHIPKHVVKYPRHYKNRYPKNKRYGF